jgi:hypothetical protein
LDNENEVWIREEGYMVGGRVGFNDHQYQQQQQQQQQQMHHHPLRKRFLDHGERDNYMLGVKLNTLNYLFVFLSIFS